MCIDNLPPINYILHKISNSSFFQKELILKNDMNMKKRILFTGLLLLLTLGAFATTPVATDNTHAQKIVEAIHNPKTD